MICEPPDFIYYAWHCIGMVGAVGACSLILYMWYDVAKGPR